MLNNTAILWVFFHFSWKVQLIIYLCEKDVCTPHLFDPYKYLCNSNLVSKFKIIAAKGINQNIDIKYYTELSQSSPNTEIVNWVNMGHRRGCSFMNTKWNCNFVGLLHHPLWLQLLLALFGHYFSTFYTTCLAKDHWRGFSTRNAHMVHIVNLFRLKMVYTS